MKTPRLTLREALALAKELNVPTRPQKGGHILFFLPDSQMVSVPDGRAEQPVPARLSLGLRRLRDSLSPTSFTTSSGSTVTLTRTRPRRSSTPTALSNCLALAESLSIPVTETPDRYIFTDPVTGRTAFTYKSYTSVSYHVIALLDDASLRSLPYPPDLSASPPPKPSPDPDPDPESWTSTHTRRPAPSPTVIIPPFRPPPIRPSLPPTPLARLRAAMRSAHARPPAPLA